MCKNMLYKLMAFSVATLIAPAGYATSQCEAIPDCADIGYVFTAQECGDLLKIKCPFGDAYFCSKANCVASAGYYDSCPTGAKCTEGEKVDGCYAPTACAAGYASVVPTGMTCTTDSFKTYLGETKPCYKNCSCNTSSGYFTAEADCKAYQLTTNHLLCYKLPSEQCYHERTGYCSLTACRVGSSCYETNLCSGKRYASHTSRNTSGESCVYRRRKTSNIGTGTDLQGCVSPSGRALSTTNFSSQVYYSSCSCADGYMYDLGKDETECICHKEKYIEVALTPTYSGYVSGGEWVINAVGFTGSVTVRVVWVKKTDATPYNGGFQTGTYTLTNNQTVYTGVSADYGIASSAGIVGYSNVTHTVNGNTFTTSIPSCAYQGRCYLTVTLPYYTDSPTYDDNI